MKKKFKTLEHNGPIFPKEYEYKGYTFEDKKLSPLAEEMLWHYAAKIETDYVKDQGFVDNFWSCLKKEVKTQKSFPADFMPLLKKMKKQQDTNKELKKIEMQALSKEERKLVRESQKEQREVLKLQYGNAVLDGEVQPLGVFMIEPPGIMMARGKSPLRGLWKYRVNPEDVIINYIGPKEGCPKAPTGHTWKDVIENHNAYVTTYYDVNVGNKVTLHKKFIFGALSDVKTESDKEKFEKAQKLCKDWNKIEKWIEDGMQSKDEKVKQSALISWLILRTGIRVGNERPEVFENFTVGASSLLVEHIKVDNNYTKLTLNFLGKDSVKYINTIDIPENVGKTLSSLIKNKSKKDKVFDSANAGTVNNFLAECLPYCTAKLFRTAYGTKLLAEELQKSNVKKTMADYEKKAVYDNACLAVSIKLNHQKNVAKTFDTQIEKVDDKIALSKDALKKRKEVAKEKLLKIKKEIEIAKKCFEGEKLKEKLAKLKEKKDRIQKQIENAEVRVKKLELNKDLKKATKTISLATARTAYSSPKIVYSFCKDLDLDIKFVYNKALQEKYKWAENTSSSYWKNYPTSKD